MVRALCFHKDNWATVKLHCAPFSIRSLVGSFKSYEERNTNRTNFKFGMFSMYYQEKKNKFKKNKEVRF